MGGRKIDLLQGTLDLLVLRALESGPRHGYGVLRWLRQVSDGELSFQEGALYPALHRLEARDRIEAEWGLTEAGRQAKFYRLTEPGREQLAADTATWNRYVSAVARILGAPA